MCCDGLIEGHAGDHTGVPDRLEVHKAAVLGPLQLNHDQVGIAIESQEVDPAAAVLPAAELLRGRGGV